MTAIVDIAFLVLVVSIIGLIVQLIRRRPARRWGITAIVSLVIWIVALGIQGANSSPSTGKEETTSKPSTTAKTQATTAQQTTAVKTTPPPPAPPASPPPPPPPAPPPSPSPPTPPQPVPPSPPQAQNVPQGEDPNGYYASSSRNAYLIYCASNSEWRSLSKNNLRYFATLEQARAAYPNRQLRC